MLRQLLIFLSTALITILLIVSCNKKNRYDIDHYISEELQDSLLTDIVIYTYKVPRGVSKNDKFNPEYRYLYKNELSKFELLYYHIDIDSTHYFLMIRPVRHALDHKRGVAGQFKLTSDFKIYGFKEIFNTPMLPEETIRERAEYLWRDLMYYKNIERYYLNMDYVEFPNAECTYDTTLHEWVY